VGAEAGALVTEPRPSWRVTCSCAWEREASSAWAANVIVRLHVPASRGARHRAHAHDRGAAGVRGDRAAASGFAACGTSSRIAPSTPG
jgi:hypothetical protein